MTAKSIRDARKGAFWRGFYSVVPQWLCYVWASLIVAASVVLWCWR